MQNFLNKCLNFKFDPSQIHFSRNLKKDLIRFTDFFSKHWSLKFCQNFKKKKKKLLEIHEYIQSITKFENFKSDERYSKHCFDIKILKPVDSSFIHRRLKFLI